MSNVARTPLAALVVLGLSLLAHASPQTEPPPTPATPAATPAEAAGAELSKQFTGNERSDEAKASAARRIEHARTAYHQAPTLSDTVTLKIATPQGPQADTVTIAMGQGTDARVGLTGARIIAVDGTVTLIPDQPANRALQVPLDGDLFRTMRSALPGFSLPAPHFALRHAEVVDAASLGLDALSSPSVQGYREADGVGHILLEDGSGGAGIVSIDLATNLLRRSEFRFAVPGAPANYIIAVDASYAPVIAEQLVVPVALDLTGRTTVASIQDLAPKPKAIAVGAASPDWTLKGADGAAVALRDLRGSVVVLDLWATWCGPCKRGLPFVNEFADWAASSGRPIKVFAVNTLENGSPEERLTKATAWWSQQKFSMPLLFDFDDSLYGSFGLSGIPATIVIGPDGRIAALHLGIDPKNPGGMVDMLKSESERALAATEATTPSPSASP